jgi:hypothetical protein
MVQIVPPRKITRAVRIIGIEATLALMLRNSRRGRLAISSAMGAGSFLMIASEGLRSAGG